jgi:hypothetical protein
MESVGVEIRALHVSYGRGRQVKNLLPAPLKDAGVVSCIQPFAEHFEDLLIIGRVRDTADTCREIRDPY